MPVTPPDPRWSSPPADVSLPSEEIHVWRAPLDVRPSREESLFHTLADDERRRATSLCFQRDRSHFIVARGALRAILGRYMNMDPGRLRFCYGPQGKPRLTPETGGKALRFNLSHSHGLALVAVNRERAIGIDLERLRNDLDLAGIAQRFFSPHEVAVLRTLPTHRRPAAFFHCWTRKEAYIKARGEGLSLPLDQFDVSLSPGDAALLSVRGAPGEAARWSLLDVVPDPAYVAAVAVEGRGGRVACWQWPEGGD